MKRQILSIKEFMGEMEEQLLELTKRVTMVYEKEKIIAIFGDIVVTDKKIDILSRINLIEDLPIHKVLNYIIDHNIPCNMLVKQKSFTIEYSGIEMKRKLDPSEETGFKYYITNMGIDVQGELLTFDDVELNMEIPIE